MQKTLYVFPVVILLSAVPLSSFAQVSQGTLRINADTVFLSYAKGNYTDIEIENTFGPSAIDQGDIHYSEFTLGLGQPSAGISMGWAAVDNLVVGLRLTLGYETRTMEESETAGDTVTKDQSLFAWGALPYIEYVFPTGLLRPFLMITLGFNGYTDDGDIASNENTDIAEWQFYAGGGGGLHMFFADAFSLDLVLTAAFGYGFGSVASESTKMDYRNTLFQLTTLIGVSGWV